MSATTAPPSLHVRRRTRIGSVSFLNAKPLLYGLDDLGDVDLTLDVPSRLLDGLTDHRFDVALLPVIDYQRMAGLRILTAGGIGCDGPTLTVRIFSRTPISDIHTLACDTDSHTSVALARVILAEQFGILPRIVDYNSRDAGAARLAADDATALLLIGDKVVTDEPPNRPHQLDLGAAWKELTGLPFVFAAWMARQGVEVGTLWSDLHAARIAGLRHVDEIVATYALPRGWPAPIAKKYLTEYLKFDITPRHVRAIRLFHELSHRHEILAYPPRNLELIEA